MDAVTILYLAAYATSTGFFLLRHMGGGQRAAGVGRALLTAGFLLQLGDIGVRCVRLQHPASSTPEAIALIAWLIAGGFLLASLRYRLDAAGAFAVAPVLVLLLLARVVPSESAAAPLGSLGLTHILLATLGVATFALAAAVAVLYLWQERQLRHKHLEQLRGKSTPLDTLDRLAARCVSFGFLVFTLGIVTGALWVARLGLVSGRADVRPEYVLALASWLAFGVLLLARAGAGWRGRRAAWLTLGGFAGALLVVVSYFIRHAA